MKKRNYIGAAECRIWMREKYIGKEASDLSRENLEVSDTAIAKRFNINQATVSNIRRELGIVSARERMYLAENFPNDAKVAPEKPVRPAWIAACKWVVLRDGDSSVDFNTIGRISSVNEERGMESSRFYKEVLKRVLNGETTWRINKRNNTVVCNSRPMIISKVRKA